MCNKGVLKCTFLLINVLFFLSGITLVVLAAIGQSKLKEIQNVLGPNIFPAINFVLVVGIFIICVSFFGMMAGCCEKTCLLNMFGTILVLLLLLQFVAAVVLFVKKTSIVNSLDDELFKSLKNAYTNSSKPNAATEYFDKLQRENDCCGVNNATDYESLNKTIPKTCCPSPSNCSLATAYPTGCLKIAEHTFSNALVVIALADIIFCFITLVQTVFTFCLVRSVNEYTTV